MKAFENAFTRDELIDLLDDPETPRISTGTVRELIRSLIAEMDKPGVWDGAPGWATRAAVNWSAQTHYSGVYKEYTRELPKSRAREIAEEAWGDCHSDMTYKEEDISRIESSILKALAEKEAWKC